MYIHTDTNFTNQVELYQYYMTGLTRQIISITFGMETMTVYEVSINCCI